MTLHMDVCIQEHITTRRLQNQRAMKKIKLATWSQSSEFTNHHHLRRHRLHNHHHLRNLYHMLPLAYAQRHAQGLLLQEGPQHLYQAPLPYPCLTSWVSQGLVDRLPEVAVHHIHCLRLRRMDCRSVSYRRTNHLANPSHCPQVHSAAVGNSAEVGPADTDRPNCSAGAAEAHCSLDCCRERSRSHHQDHHHHHIQTTGLGCCRTHIHPVGCYWVEGDPLEEYIVLAERRLEVGVREGAPRRSQVGTPLY